MKLVFSPQLDGSILAWGRSTSAEYSYDARHFVSPGSAFFGLTWDELSTLAWIETNDDGSIVHREPRSSIMSQQIADLPSFIIKQV